MDTSNNSQNKETNNTTIMDNLDSNNLSTQNNDEDESLLSSNSDCDDVSNIAIVNENEFENDIQDSFEDSYVNVSSSLDSNLNSDIKDDNKSDIKDDTKSDDNKSNDNNQINTDENKMKFYVANMKTKEELELETKLNTEKEIYKLGVNQALKEKEEKDFNEKYETLKDYVSKNNSTNVNDLIEDIIKNKKYLFLQTMLNNYIGYINILNSMINVNKKKIKNLSEDKDDLDTQVNELIEETETLNDSVEKYEKRVNKLREKCITKNHKLKLYFYYGIALNINSYIIGHLGFSNYLKNILNFSIKIIYFLKIILYIIANYTKIIIKYDYTLHILFGVFILYLSYFKLYLRYKKII